MSNLTHSVPPDITFGANTIPISTANVPTSVYGIALDSSYTKMVFAGTPGVMWYSKYSSGNWSVPTSFWNPTSITSNTFVNVCITPDGTKGAISAKGGYCYYFTWTGSTPGTPTQTSDTTARTYNGIDITTDGSRIVIAVGHWSTVSGYVYFANWNSSSGNYDAFTQTGETTLERYQPITVMGDGSRIVYGIYHNAAPAAPRLAFWNGTNYSSSTPIGTATFLSTAMKMTTDGEYIFMSTGAGNFYSKYVAGNYTEFMPVANSALYFWGANGMALDRTTDSIVMLIQYTTKTLIQSTLTYG